MTQNFNIAQKTYLPLLQSPEVTCELYSRDLCYSFQDFGEVLSKILRLVCLRVLKTAGSRRVYALQN